MLTRLLFSAAAAAFLAGCATQPSQPPTAQAVSAPAAIAAAPSSRGASTFDGRYTGSSTAAGGGGRYLCPPSGDNTTVVRNGVVTGRWNNNPIQAPVQPDGSFSGASGVGRMNGKIVGDKMEYEIAGQSCKRTYSLSRT